MDAFWAWFWGAGWFWFAMFWMALLVNGRAAFKLLLDWKGMLTTCRLVDDAYATLDTLPDEAALEHEPAAPVFVHLVPAWQEPGIATSESIFCCQGGRPSRRRRTSSAVDASIVEWGERSSSSRVATTTWSLVCG